MIPAVGACEDDTAPNKAVHNWLIRIKESFDFWTFAPCWRLGLSKRLLWQNMKKILMWLPR